MADMFVHSLVENLKELMRSKHPIIGSKRNQATLGFLHNNVSVMSNFLKRTELEKCSADEEVKLLLTEIRDVTYEVENYVDTFVQEAIVAGREHADAINRIRQRLSSSTWKTFWKNQLTLQVENYVNSFVQEAIITARKFRPRSDRNYWKMLRKLIEAVKIGVDHMNAKLDLSKLTLKTSYRSADDGQKRVRIEDSETVVGIEDTMDKLLSRLSDGRMSMEVISIVGSPGIGKSTVAQRLFNHGRIKSSFLIRAWSTVSQTYDCKRLLIDILQSSSLFEDDDVNYSVDELGEELLKRLKGKRYLVVLDDVWGIEAWNDIQRSFPDQHNRSRVLFTSRFAAIGKDVSINTHYMSGLSEEHSWNLLKNKVFGQGQCPPELVGSGMEIVRKCDGLPLAIVLTGGLLAKKDKNPEFWEQVASNLAPALATDQETSFMNTIELSYQHLPVHLKACFLYLGSFPLEHKFSLRELIWLLIAEGFVIQETEEKSLEVTAEDYLNELVEWSLVTVSRKRSCGAMKVVRIHDLLRVFCVARGNQEKFITTPYEYFDELLRNNAGCIFQMWESILKEQRRLYISNAVLDSYYYRPSNVRSFWSDSLTFQGPSDFFVSNFKLLKVLHIGRNYYQGLHGLENLVHLRYLSFGHRKRYDGGDTELVLSVTKLLNLETFVAGYGGALHLPDDIWNMVKLKHLYNKYGRFHFQASPPQGAVLGNLQTLHSLCACDSCLTILVRTPNIRTLGLSEYLRYPPGGDLLNLCFLKQLETLKVFGPISSWKVGIVPNLELPASLRKLTLYRTFLRWENISFLEQLPNLEVLKLLENAFSSKKTDVVKAYWDTSKVDFLKLKYLKLQGLDDIVKWEDQHLQIDRLEVLILDNCRRLKTIPFDLAECPYLQTIEVTGCTNSVSELAKKIEVEHENMYGNSNLQVFITYPYTMYDEWDDSDEHDDYDEHDDSDEHDESDDSDEHDDAGEDDSDEAELSDSTNLALHYHEVEEKRKRGAKKSFFCHAALFWP